jgi:hypothetical protein
MFLQRFLVNHLKNSILQGSSPLSMYIFSDHISLAGVRGLVD